VPDWEGALAPRAGAVYWGDPCLWAAGQVDSRLAVWVSLANEDKAFGESSESHGLAAIHARPDRISGAARRKLASRIRALKTPHVRAAHAFRGRVEALGADVVIFPRRTRHLQNLKVADGALKVDGGHVSGRQPVRHITPSAQKSVLLLRIAASPRSNSAFEIHRAPVAVATLRHVASDRVGPRS